MTSAADGELESALTRQIDHARNVVRVRNLDNGCWMAIDAAIKDGPRFVVVGVARRDNTIREVTAKF